MSCIASDSRQPLPLQNPRWKKAGHMPFPMPRHVTTYAELCQKYQDSTRMLKSPKLWINGQYFFEKMFDSMRFTYVFGFFKISKVWKDSDVFWCFLFKPLGDTNCAWCKIPKIRNLNFQKKYVHGGVQISYFSEFQKTKIWKNHICLKCSHDFFLHSLNIFIINTGSTGP